MGFEGLSSGVVIALAAVLWLVYLVPTWFRRREYLSTERNAVRLQQTLRIMAETAEVPDEVRVENSVRGVAAQEKLMHREMQRTKALQDAQDAAAARAAARQLAETQPAIAAHVARNSAASRRLRRSRFVSSVVLFASLVGLGFGVAQLVAGAGMLLLGASAVVAIGAMVLLRQLSAVASTRAQLASGLKSRPRVSTPVQDFVQAEASQLAPAAPSQWTPVPVPKPLYLSKPEAPAVPLVTFARAAELLARPTAVADASAVTPAAADGAAVAARAAEIDADIANSAQLEELRAASERSEQALREAQAATARLAPRPVAEIPPAAPSRFASMGVIDEAELAPTDLDEALRRRRAV